MGYYWCKNCGDIFHIKYRKNPKYCKRCKNPHKLSKIDRKQYLEWMQMRKDAENYNRVYGCKVYDYCKIIWDDYDRKHNIGSI